jgi:hypothetical protein
MLSLLPQLVQSNIPKFDPLAHPSNLVTRGDPAKRPGMKANVYSLPQIFLLVINDM